MQTTSQQPAPAAGAFSHPAATEQREMEKAALRVLKLRQMAFAEIERLIAFLDASDGYSATELEADYGSSREADEEPWLGSGAVGEWSSQSGWAQGAGDDRELADDVLELGECEDEEDCGDYEPALASPENHVLPVNFYGAPPKERWTDTSGDQTTWARGQCQDCEDEHDGREDPDEDHDSNCDDEPDDSGIGDQDGLIEQLSGVSRFAPVGQVFAE